jgi:hypothetical protein
VVSAIFANERVHLMSLAYSDEELVHLIQKTCEITAVEADDLVREFGVFTGETTFPRLYPAYFSIAGAARPFLLTVEDRIHELVRATIPSASPPELVVSPLGDDGVQIDYTSPRRLCMLLRGLAEGTALHYGERVEIEETACMRRGDPACHFDIRFNP